MDLLATLGCFPECYVVEFGALPPLPDRWFVAWHAEHEHFQAHGPNDWESVVTVDRFQARRWAMLEAEKEPDA